MAVSIRCSCGKLLDAEEHLRGQTVQCPHCQVVVHVPAATAALNPVNAVETAKAADASAKKRKEAEQQMITVAILGFVIALTGGILYFGFGIWYGKGLGCLGALMILAGSGGRL